MSPAELAFRARLEREAARMAPETARRYLEAYRLIRQSLNERELANAIRGGYVEALLDELVSGDSMDPVLARLRTRLDQMVLDSARKHAENFLPSWLQPPAFNTLNPRVVEAARDLRTGFLDTLKGEVRDVLRAAVVQGLEDGKNPRTIARQAKTYVGLSDEQLRWVENFRRELETGDRSALRRALGKGVITKPDGTTIVRKAHAQGRGLTKKQLEQLDRMLGKEPLTPDQIDTYAEAYRKRLEAWNTEAHTRTATLQAQKEGQRLSWIDAIDRGVVTAEELERTWLAVGGPDGDGRNRPEHLVLHGETVGFYERFSNGQLVPGDDEYGCRCGDRVRVKRRSRRTDPIQEAVAV